MHNLVLPSDTWGARQVSSTDIEGIAEKHLGTCRPDALLRPTAVDMDVFAEYHLGLKLDYALLSPDPAFFGVLVFRACDVPVYSPDTLECGRIHATEGSMVLDYQMIAEESMSRLAVAHLCAHSILHGGLRLGDEPGMPTEAAPWLLCSPDVQPLSPLRGWIEQQAIHLSLALLMPRQAVYLLASNVRACGTEDSCDLTGHVMNAFQVSADAAALRVKMLAL